MIKNVNIYGLHESMIASGYPMSSTEVTDMREVGEADFKRAGKLGNAKAGSGHDCFLKGVVVQFDLDIPQYIWMQVERYHFLDIISSQSKMHRITKLDFKKQCNEFVDQVVIDLMVSLIDQYNNEDLDKDAKKVLFNRIVSNCPMGYRLTARITTNYLQLKTIHNQRKYHKMEEWHEICGWMESLPKFKEFCLS